MGFNEIPKVETPDFYLDLAFGRAKKESSGLRSTKLKGSSLNIKINIELVKLKSVKETLNSSFNSLIKNFPSVDQLDEFYLNLMKCYFSVPDFRKALSTLNWSIGKLNDFYKEYSLKMKHAKTIERAAEVKGSFYGRISSLLKRLKPHLKLLEEARRSMREFPTIKTKLFTVSIFGFPNVGKSTLLSKISDSNPEISNYAFTTKRLNMGYSDINGEKIQFLDTPGSLNRFEKMNAIEKQAYLALKYCTHVIIYVFDPTEASYPMKDQKKLLLSLKEFDKPVIIYLSKTDIIKDMPDIKFDYVSDVEELKKKIEEEIY